MFSYLRYFFVTSFLVILASAVLFGWYYRATADNIIRDVVQQNNMALAKSFSNTIWNATSGYKRKIDNAPDIELTNSEMLSEYFVNNKALVGKPEDYIEFVNFSNKTRDFLRDLEIVQFNIYTPDGKKLLSTNRAKILKPGGDPAYVINGYNDNEISAKNLFASDTPEAESQIIYDAEYVTPQGTKTNGVLIRSLIPLRADNSPDNVVSFTNSDSPEAQNIKPQAVLEIFYDVTKNSNKLRRYQWFSAGFSVIFTLLYLTLIYTTRRAEKIIEKQHETNVDLAAAKSSAEDENQQKSQFLSNISHELRTPLNAIIGFSEIMKDEVMGTLNNEQYKNYVRDIHSSGVYLLSLINDILDYSKAEAGKLDIEYEEIDLNKLIASCLRLQEPRAKSAEVNLAKELPDEHLVIRSDAKRLRQIMLNILSNAVKFTPAGGTVKVSAWRNLQDNKNISIEVRDTGIGIAPKDIAKALAPFGQVDSELSRRYEGTGLGLPLTKKFTELLGGQLKLSSEVGKGTTVTVILPVNNDVNSLAPKR